MGRHGRRPARVAGAIIGSAIALGGVGPQLASGATPRSLPPAGNPERYVLADDPALAAADDAAITALTTQPGPTGAVRAPLASLGSALGDPAGSAQPLRPVGGELDGLDPAAVAFGYRFSRADTADDRWKPQGITTSEDAGSPVFTPGGLLGGTRRMALVSWAGTYPDAPAAQRSLARISAVDLGPSLASTSAAPACLNMVLVRATGTGAGATIEPVRDHTGGIAGVGRWLYAVDSDASGGTGLRVYDLGRVLRMTGGNGGVGCSTASCTALATRYAIPEVRYYRAAARTRSFRFSWMSVDHTEGGRKLTLGEFRPNATAARPGRVLSFALGADDLPLAPGGQARALAAWKLIPNRIQGGVFTSKGVLAASQSATAADQRPAHGPALLRLSTGAKAARPLPWPQGPEGLALGPGSGVLHSVTERDDHKVLFGVRAARLGR